MKRNRAQGCTVFGLAKNSESFGVFARADFALTAPVLLCE